MKTEKGVMIMKDGKAWGETYTDGRSTSYGWMDVESAPIHNPKYCRKHIDATWKGSYYTKELETAKIVHVVRTTDVTVRIL